MFQRRSLSLFPIVIFFLFCHAYAEAREDFTVTQISPSLGASVTMGSIETMTFRVANTGSPSRKIVSVTFKLRRGRNTKGGAFLSGTPPEGWASTGKAGRKRITFKTTSWDHAIDVGGVKDFKWTMRAGSAPEDVNETLRKVSARFSKRETGSRKKASLRNVGSWTLKSLEIASFKITNMAGNPVASEMAGRNFRLVMTIVNRSTARQANITTSPNPPVATRSGTVTLPPSPQTTYRPQPLTLSTGELGEIASVYRTASTDVGSLFFTAFARNNTGRATSATASSNTLVVSQFIADIAVSPPCAYDAQNVTVLLRLTNGYPYNIVNITPSLSSSAGAPIRYQSGPTPSRINELNAGGSGTFTWGYQINGGNPGDTFTFTGSATGTGETDGNPSRTTPDVTSLPSKKGGNFPTVRPLTTYASSTNQELTWSLTNENGCAPIRSVSILVPSGWLWGRDSYSLVEQISPPNPDSVPTESWVVSGSNPVVFTAPGGRELQIGQSASFSLVFSKTPTAAGSYLFDLTMADTNGASEIKRTAVIVHPFNTGGGNAADTEIFREDFK